MMVTATSEDGSGRATARLLFDTVGKWMRCVFQVYGPNTVFIAKDMQTLNVPSSRGNQGGLSLTAAEGKYSDWFFGKVYWTSSAPYTEMDYELMGEGTS